MKSATAKIPPAVMMLGVVSLFTDAASEMIYPLVPVFIGLLGSGAIVLGLIEGVAETTAAMLKLASGILSDKTGKRKLFVLIGYSLSTLVRPLAGLVTAGWQVIVVRMFDRVGKGIRTAPRDALIASAVDESIRGKSYGFHRAMDHAGAVLGPLLAIATLLILVVGFQMKSPLQVLRWTFLLALIPGIFAVLTIVFFVQESTAKTRNAPPFRFSLQSFDKNFVAFLGIIILFTLGNSSDAFLLFRVEETIQKSGAVIHAIRQVAPLRDMIASFGNAEAQAQIINVLFLPLIWAFFHIIKVAFSTPLGALSDRIGRKAVINAGWAIYALVYVGFALIVFLTPGWQIVATFALFAVYALFYAFTEGAEKALVADLVGEEKRGSAFGLYNFAIGLGALPASVIFGFLYSFFDAKCPGWGGTVAFGFGAGLALISMTLLAVSVKEPRKA